MKRNPYQAVSPSSGSHWRSLEHKEAGTLPDIDVEFPSGTAPLSEMRRRDVLKLAGATMALGGLAACVRRPEEEILPYTRQPEDVIPGIPNFYATAQPRSEGALGLVVEAHEGRPTKIEGNALHAASQGATDVWAQAEILKLYDPDRARAPRLNGKTVAWTDWDTYVKSQFGERLATGQGLAILLEDDDSPTMQRVLDAGLRNRPNAKVYRWDPLAPDHAQQGAAIAFGPGARVHYDIEKARAVLSLDSNFLMEGPDHVRHARAFGRRRQIVSAAEGASMLRLYAVEGVFTPTGASADHRLRLPSANAPQFLKALASELGVNLGEAAAAASAQAPAGTETFLKALAKDLRNGGVIIVGERQPAAVHALAYAVNAALGATSNGIMTVTAGPPRASTYESIAALTKALAAGEVDTLVVVEANPAYTAPGAAQFREALKKAKAVVHVGVMPDETAKAATWHVPAAHFLEAWGDARAWDGTASIVQPLILPLHGARAPISLVAQILGLPETGDKKLVEETWRAGGAPLAVDKAWRRALHDGVIPGSARAPAQAAPAFGALAQALGALKAAGDGVELVVQRRHLLDGRLANVTWCQELPDSITKLCWDNALVMSPSLAKELGVDSRVRKNGYRADLVEVSANGRSVTMPVFIAPGLAKNTVTVAWGYGKRAGGDVALGGGVDPGTFTVNEKDPQVGRGVDPNPLFGDDTHLVFGVQLKKVAGDQELCSTQDHFAMPGNPLHESTFQQKTVEKGDARRLNPNERPHYRRASLKIYQENPQFARWGDIPSNLLEKGTNPLFPLQPKQPTDDIVYENQQWGMIIDLTTCIGCDACTIACQAENNIPVVGRHEVLLGREMHWIRVDRYFSGDVDEPEAGHQPVPCMQCENAPCEPVCPVSATVHDDEGLNAMAYNRCIGTRYCANNCPYKVRRFNYLDFTNTGNVQRNDYIDERNVTLKLQRNPNVTVRYRGVMEKCTYCTQRIEEAKIAAKRNGKDRKNLPDGAVTPACAQACPTNAIVFGNIADPNSRVSKLKASDRNYELLQELNVRPRTTYLARVKNTNTELG